jgi:vacuolar protein sorting-associated protein VTA1
VKAFYTSGMLFDVLTTFGELSEELLQNRKYAKWKAAYIHSCLKNGERPVPGPLQEGEELGDGSLNQEEEDSDPRSSGLLGDYRETAGASGIG